MQNHTSTKWEKNVNTYKVLYSDIHHDKDGWVDEFPKNDFVKKKLQEGVVRANEMNWRFSLQKKTSSNKIQPKQKNTPKKKKLRKKMKIDSQINQRKALSYLQVF